MEKKPSHQDQDTLYSQRKEDEKQWGEFGELAQDVFKDWIKHWDGTSGQPAKDWKDGGRACFRCAGSLMIFEESDNGNLLLQCKSCGQHQWLTDVSPYSAEDLKELEKEAREVGAKARHLPDELYRTIPDSLVLQYTEMRKKRRQGY
ncbi:hypothetical protein IRB79_27245 (plasmid) [Cytobacillus oceanisediminis]|nr:hypothetical protein IRB79_27245 [Cytobacillus oceanisediminis]